MKNEVSFSFLFALFFFSFSLSNTSTIFLKIFIFVSVCDERVRKNIGSIAISLCGQRCGFFDIYGWCSILRLYGPEKTVPHYPGAPSTAGGSYMKTGGGWLCPPPPQ